MRGAALSSSSRRRRQNTSGRDLVAPARWNPEDEERRFSTTCRTFRSSARAEPTVLRRRLQRDAAAGCHSRTSHTRTEGDWRTGRFALTVYYLGVPDTTPEFTTEAALEQYLAVPPSPQR